MVIEPRTVAIITWLVILFIIIPIIVKIIKRRKNQDKR